MWNCPGFWPNRVFARSISYSSLAVRRLSWPRAQQEFTSVLGLFQDCVLLSQNILYSVQCQISIRERDCPGCKPNELCINFEFRLIILIYQPGLLLLTVTSQTGYLLVFDNPCYMISTSNTMAYFSHIMFSFCDAYFYNEYEIFSGLIIFLVTFNDVSYTL